MVGSAGVGRGSTGDAVPTPTRRTRRLYRYSGRERPRADAGGDALDERCAEGEHRVAARRRVRAGVDGGVARGWDARELPCARSAVNKKLRRATRANDAKIVSGRGARISSPRSVASAQFGARPGVVHGIDPRADLRSTREGSRFSFALETRAGVAPRGSIDCRIGPSNRNNRPRRTIPVVPGAMVLFPDVPRRSLGSTSSWTRSSERRRRLAGHRALPLRHVRPATTPPGAILNADFRRSIAELNVACDDDSYDAVARSCAFQDARAPGGLSPSAPSPPPREPRPVRRRHVRHPRRVRTPPMTVTRRAASPRRARGGATTPSAAASTIRTTTDRSRPALVASRASRGIRSEQHALR